MTPNLSTAVETSSDAVGPTEAASYLDISIDGWQQMLADGVVPAIPCQPGYVRRNDLRVFKLASDAIISNAMIQQAEAGHEDEADVIPLSPPDDGDWIKALLALATTSAYRTGWRLGFGAGLGVGAIVSALVLILAAWLRSH